MVVFGAGHASDLKLIYAFALPIILSAGAGVLLHWSFRTDTINNTHAMLICSVGWLVFSAVGAIPYVIAIGSSFIDGFFEAMSGFTTTGITMYTGLDEMPRCVIFWRALTQWIGGLGILTFFLAIRSRGAGSHWLFGAESHKIDLGRPVPGLANTLAILWFIYSGFTAATLLGLWATGMSFFDSVCHSFTALSTGGFSPHDASIEYYQLAGFRHYILIEYILIIGMILGGTNFLIHYRVLKGRPKALYDNMEMRYWWGFIGIFIIIIFMEKYIDAGAQARAGLTALEESFRATAFQVVSVITTTGFGTRDIGSSVFGSVARQLFLVMMVIGGCVGSTGGGIKVLRIGILVQIIRREVFRLRTPHLAVSAVVVDGKRVETDEISRVSGLFFTWIVFLVIGGLCTALLSRYDAIQSCSGMFSALGNIGPCYIPYQEMGQLNPLIKIVYIIGMLAGRLEILPVLLLFSGKAWRMG
ncbi:MAG: TrkH family potassium uptake protein [Candidatus Krumholzibacteriota bacterium]|nr:TrkH family potassium uptake protein [Candidatus Krumholzibacteriota bacterium]